MVCSIQQLDDTGSAMSGGFDQSPTPAEGAFAVDGSGQATYRLPLPLPAWRDGGQPRLELVYEHRLPNGVLGIGWRIGALSAISRTGASYALDGYNGAVNVDARDRFALDGQRLVAVDGEYGRAGTTYHAPVRGLKQVRAGQSDAEGFVAIGAGGEIRTYGTTPDSRLLAQGSSKVRLWSLDAVEDLYGNRIEYHYFAVPVQGGADCGACYLDHISYRQRDDAAARTLVRFTYEERPDPVAMFVGGHAASTLYRLRQIAIWRDDEELLHCYDLEYGLSAATHLSRLCSITERSLPDPARRFLPFLTVGWQDTPAPGFDIGTPVALDEHADTLAVEPMNVSGNGCTDLVQLWRDESECLHATCYLANVGGTFSGGMVSRLGAFPPDCAILPADLDGDGKTDLLVAYRHPASGHLVLAPFLSGESGLVALPEHDTGDQFSADHLGFYTMDVNGDGRTDLVEAYGQPGPQGGKLLHFRSYLSILGADGPRAFTAALVTPTTDPAFPARQLAMWPMDVNGDGMIDMVRVWVDGAKEEVHVTSYISVSSAIDSVRFSTRRDTRLGRFALGGHIAFLPVDINGDGSMDLLRVWEAPGDDGPVLHLTSLISNGAGAFFAGADSCFEGRRFDPRGFHPMGFSGGCQTQLLGTWTTEVGERMLTIFAPSPSGLFRLVADLNAGSPETGLADARLLVGDVNGDGKADLVCVGRDQAGRPVAHTYLSRGPCPDLVCRLCDQHGAVTVIDYAPLSDTSIHAPARQPRFPESAALRYPSALAPAQFPVEGVLGQAVHVVARYSLRQPAGGYTQHSARQFSFGYASGRLDLLERGCLGFDAVTMQKP
jgi:hypothetical protein